MRWKIFMSMLALLTGLIGAADSSAQSGKQPTKKSAAPTRRKAPVRARARTTRRAPTAVNQRQPAKDRYLEIQRALADAGHYAGEPNGIWKQDSVEALKSFQAENGFEPTGKIDARSLIKMGLGPRYGPSSADAPDDSAAGDARQSG